MDEEAPGKLRPTIVTPPARGAKPSVSEAARPPTPTVLQPTAINGTARRRIAVTVGDLCRLSPGATKVVIDRALALLEGFVVEKASERKAILWGHGLQMDHGNAVTESLALAQAPVMRRMQGHIARMLEILGAFDVMAVAQSGNGIGGLLRSLNTRIDTVDELAAARAEIDQIIRLMGNGLDELLDLRERLEKNAGVLETIAGEAEAAALAALYLSDHLRPTAPAIADNFLSRSMSLTQTLTQIRGNSSIRDMQRQHPIEIIGAIQNATLVSMPDFLASLAAINALGLRDAVLSPTQANELNYKLHDIIQQLKA